MRLASVRLRCMWRVFARLCTGFGGHGRTAGVYVEGRVEWRAALHTTSARAAHAIASRRSARGAALTGGGAQSSQKGTAAC